MKTKIYFLIYLFMGIIISAVAQEEPEPEPEDNKMEMMKNERISFFNEKIKFTPEESNAFWPVYNEYDQKRIDLMKEKRKLMKQCYFNESNMSDKEIIGSCNKFKEIQNSESELSKEYFAHFEKILPPVKLMRFYIAEEQFRRYLLRQMRGHKGSERHKQN